MKLIDMHCDTLGKFQWEKGRHLRENDFCIDLMKMKKAGSLAQFFACFIYAKRFQDGDMWEQSYNAALKMIAEGKKELTGIRLMKTEGLLRRDLSGNPFCIWDCAEGTKEIHR